MPTAFNGAQETFYGKEVIVADREMVEMVRGEEGLGGFIGDLWQLEGSLLACCCKLACVCLL
jgi:hypothetical protein